MGDDWEKKNGEGLKTIAPKTPDLFEKLTWRFKFVENMNSRASVGTGVQIIT